MAIQICGTQHDIWWQCRNFHTGHSYSDEIQPCNTFPSLLIIHVALFQAMLLGNYVTDSIICRVIKMCLLIIKIYIYIYK